MPPSGGTAASRERSRSKAVARERNGDSQRVRIKVNPPSRGIPTRTPSLLLSMLAAFVGILLVYLAIQIHATYAFSWQNPFVLHLQSPLVIAERTRTTGANEAELDQFGHPLSAYQQYACRKFGSACRTALAIQRAENPSGKCEIYHYNSDGTLDWGYFQINTVHLKRPGLNLRDLLDCRANIDFAYELYTEQHGFSPWSTYKSGAYLEFLRNPSAPAALKP